MDKPIETLLNTPDVVTRLLVDFGPNLMSALLILRVVRVLVFLLFAVMALQNLGIDLLPLLAGLGIAGAGIALALQGVLGNIAAGLMIIFTRPFKVGEYISIAGEEGVVQDITLFSTTLRHSDLSRVVIPNRKISDEILHNYGEIRQVDLRVGVAYATDLGAAVAAIKPWVAVKDIGPVPGEINPAVLAAFQDRGIHVPFPTMVTLRAPSVTQ